MLGMGYGKLLLLASQLVEIGHQFANVAEAFVDAGNPGYLSS